MCQITSVGEKDKSALVVNRFSSSSGLLCPPGGDGRQQLGLHDPGVRRRRHDGRHGRRHRRHQEEEREAPAPPGTRLAKSRLRVLPFSLVEILLRFPHTTNRG